MTDKYKWIGKRIVHNHAPVKGGTRSWRYCLSIHCVDEPACACGYIKCSGEGVCAPVVRKGPARWALVGDGHYQHTSGAVVQQRVTAGTWNWFRPGTWECTDPKPTCEQAMVAALGWS